MSVVSTLYDNQALHAADWLRGYLRSFAESDNPSYANPWGDGLTEQDGYDESRTASLDTLYRSDVVAFQDGSILHCPADGRWHVEFDGDDVTIEPN